MPTAPPCFLGGFLCCCLFWVWWEVTVYIVNTLRSGIGLNDQKTFGALKNGHSSMENSKGTGWIIGTSNPSWGETRATKKKIDFCAARDRTRIIRVAISVLI
ncbi:hypothetical protein DFS34DRAFT_592574 [Phlyctochytrium arcticum]|nr:hypothetical protein DFS34DRAFT_592573 [Phlyctochytrium arcticum]KAI9100698.1 hypothetical protein DFS34DRAFT_592574 [Phlyctochytrium arcticum]